MYRFQVTLKQDNSEFIGKDYESKELAFSTAKAFSYPIARKEELERGMLDDEEEFKANFEDQWERFWNCETEQFFFEVIERTSLL